MSVSLAVATFRGFFLFFVFSVYLFLAFPTKLYITLGQRLQLVLGQGLAQRLMNQLVNPRAIQAEITCFLVSLQS